MTRFNALNLSLILPFLFSFHCEDPYKMSKAQLQIEQQQVTKQTTQVILCKQDTMHKQEQVTQTYKHQAKQLDDLAELKLYLTSRYKGLAEKLFTSDDFQIYNVAKLKQMLNHYNRIDRISEDYYLKPELGFYTPTMFNKALDFISTYERDLINAVNLFSLDMQHNPVEIITAILALESCFGNSCGRQKLFNTLVTLYLTSKKEFAIKQLDALFNLLERGIINNAFCNCSFAGAITPAQFLPSSILMLYNLGLLDLCDINSDGLDIFSLHDAIGMIACYLSLYNFSRSVDSALYAYNKQKAYVKAVKYFANTIGLMRKEWRSMFCPWIGLEWQKTLEK